MIYCALEFGLLMCRSWDQTSACKQRSNCCTHGDGHGCTGNCCFSEKSVSPVLMVSRDHPFIPAAGWMDASSAGGSCSTSTAGSAQETSQSPANSSPFSCNRKRPFQDCFHGFRNSKPVRSPPPQHTCESNAGESSSNTCLLSTPQSLRRRHPVQRKLALA